jgi:hypothetical protein
MPPESEERQRRSGDACKTKQLDKLMKHWLLYV